MTRFASRERNREPRRPRLQALVVMREDSAGQGRNTVDSEVTISPMGLTPVKSMVHPLITSSPKT